MNVRPIVSLACAAALLQAGCSGSESKETIRVPQLRMGGPGETLLLAATERIERRNEAGVPELESASLLREVWVVSGVDPASTCAKLGEASTESDEPQGFELEEDMLPGAAINPALMLLDQLGDGADVSLLVLWSVPYTPPGAETEERRLLLDAAEYELRKSSPDISDSEDMQGDAMAEPQNLIYLEPRNGPAGDGMVDPVQGETDLPACPELGERSRDFDEDGVDTLDELNAGLPLDDAVGDAGSTPLTIDDEVDAVVVAGRGDRMSGEPLAPTWRLFGSTAPDGSRGGRLELPSGGTGDPLELRIATVPGNGSMLVEAAFPAGYDTGEGMLTMDVAYKVGEDDPDMPFGCFADSPEGVPLSGIQSSSTAPIGFPSEGVYLDPVNGEEGSSRLTVRCESEMFMPSGRLSLPLILVRVERGDAGGDESDTDLWELRDLEVFVHDVSPGSRSANER